MDDRGGFFVGFLMGGLFGLAAGILLAPDAGSETRAQVRHRAADTMDRVRDLGGRMREGLDRVGDSVRNLRSGAEDEATTTAGMEARPEA